MAGSLQRMEIPANGHLRDLELASELRDRHEADGLHSRQDPRAPLRRALVTFNGIHQRPIRIPVRRAGGGPVLDRTTSSASSLSRRTATSRPPTTSSSIPTAAVP